LEASYFVTCTFSGTGPNGGDCETLNGPGATLENGSGTDSVTGNEWTLTCLSSEDPWAPGKWQLEMGHGIWVKGGASPIGTYSTPHPNPLTALECTENGSPQIS
jgi:hypothetical protein